MRMGVVGPMRMESSGRNHDCVKLTLDPASSCLAQPPSAPTKPNLALVQAPGALCFWVHDCSAWLLKGEGVSHWHRS